jgi:rubrerythrin
MIYLKRRGIEFGFRKTPRFSFEDLYTDSSRRLKYKDFDTPARKESKFKCNICGALVSESDDTCPGCGAHFK